MFSTLVSYSDSESEKSEIDEDGKLDVKLTKKRKLQLQESADHQKGRGKTIIANQVQFYKAETVDVDDRKNSNTTKFVDGETKSKSCGTLPLPGAIIGMFEDDVADRRLVDNSANYDGRKRTFAHEEGNWATFVYIEVPYRETLGKFMEKVVEILEPLEFHLLDDFHISLSRTVVIRHHWIASLIDSLKENINKCPRSRIALEGFKVFTNDEKTRTFLALECLCSESLLEYVEKIDRSFAEFNLQKYYENPSFHVSVCWSLENKKEIISAEKMAVLQEQLFEFLDENPDLKYFEVDELLCKTGNKIFCLPLCDQ